MESSVSDASPRRLRVAVVTHDFPTAHQRHRGAPLWQTLLALQRHVDLTVYCPVPRCPGVAATWIGGGTYGEFPVGSTASFPVRPLPYLAVPVLTHARNGDSIFRGLRRQLEKERPDLIVAYWMYPDAYAAVRAGHALGITLVAGSRASGLK